MVATKDRDGDGEEGVNFAGLFFCDVLVKLCWVLGRVVQMVGEGL